MSCQVNQTSMFSATGSKEVVTPMELCVAFLIVVVIVQQYIIARRASCGSEVASKQAFVADSLPKAKTKDGKHMGSSSQNKEQVKGSVVLIGCGPGDAELLTVAALKAIQSADVVITDRLVSSSITSLIPDSATVKVSKKYKGRAQAAQQELHDWILQGAKDGLNVVRLKGGDSFVYGRGREEVQALVGSGFPVKVIPGISSVLAAPLAAGIPVTSRHVADRLVILSGHCKKPDVAHVADQQIDSVACVRSSGVGSKAYGPTDDLKTSHLKIPPFEPGTTLVFLMSVGTLADVQQQLLKVANVPQDIPVAFIERATTPQQRVTIGSVGTMLNVALEAKVASPATIVVGRVVTCIAYSGQGSGGVSTEYVPGGVIYK